MATMRVFSRTLALAPVVLAIAACGMTTPNSESCDPGDFESSALPDGGEIFYQCLRDGSAYVLYSGPNPNEPPDTGAVDANFDAGQLCSTAGGQKLTFMCPGCTTNSDCGMEQGMQMVCIDFSNKGGFTCTLPCTTDPSVCVAPSGGCGNNGNCKPGVIQ